MVYTVVKGMFLKTCYILVAHPTIEGVGNL